VCANPIGNLTKYQPTWFFPFGNGSICTSGKWAANTFRDPAALHTRHGRPAEFRQAKRDQVSGRVTSDNPAEA
jgi:hypothetical protein